MFGKDHRDDIIADLRAQNERLQLKLLALVDARAAALSLAQDRQKLRERSDPNATPRLPDMVKLIVPPGEKYESNEAMEKAFRGQQ